MATIYIPVAWDLSKSISGKGSTWHSISLDSVQGTITGNLPGNAVISNARLRVKASFSGGLSAQVYLSAGHGTGTSNINYKYIDGVKISKDAEYYYSGYILSDLFSNYRNPFDINRRGCSYITCEISSNNIIARNHYLDEIAIEVTYEEVPRYTVTVNAIGDGTAIGVGTYEKGTQVTLTASPNTGYKFSGWANQNGVITVTTNPYSFVINSDTTILAVFEKLTYTVRWYNEDGTKLLEEDADVPYGDMPDCNVTPTKEATAEHTYKFVGWQIDTVSEGITELTAVVKEINYYARFREIVNTYIVTWKNGDTILETDEAVPYGTTPDYNGTTPIKVSTPQYDYTFLGWNTEVDESPRQEEDLDDVTGHITYTAVFLPVLRKYPIEVLYDENICTVTGAASGEYEHGTKLTLTVIPKTGYYFDSWGFDWWHDESANVNDNPMTFTVLGEECVFPRIFKKAPEFIDVEMIYCGKQISEQNKVISGQGFIISAIVI